MRNATSMMTAWLATVVVFVFTISSPSRVHAALLVRRDAASLSAPVRALQSEVDSFVLPAKFAADAYCTNLQHGSAVGPDGIVLWKAGNGDDLQMVYVAYSPTLGIVVAHQGTNRSSQASIANDVRIVQQPVDARLAASSLPSSSVLVADGFQRAWIDTADDVVAQVRLAITQYPNASRVTVTGHSLGAAIGLFDALYIRQVLPATMNVTAVLFGMPRVGNQQFADAVDVLLPAQRRIINARDPVPHLPFRTFGFRHSSGEVWIPAPSKEDANNDRAVALACPGQENVHCADSVTLPHYRLDDHSGPYFGVQMDCSRP